MIKTILSIDGSLKLFMLTKEQYDMLEWLIEEQLIVGSEIELLNAEYDDLYEKPWEKGE